MINTDPAKTVTFFGVQPTPARNLLLSALRDAVPPLYEKDTLDLHEVEYTLSDEDVLGWLHLLLLGREVSFERDWDRDEALEDGKIARVYKPVLKH